APIIQQHGSVGHYLITNVKAACHPQAALSVGRGRDQTPLEAPVADCREHIALAVLCEHCCGGYRYRGAASAQFEGCSDEHFAFEQTVGIGYQQADFESPAVRIDFVADAFNAGVKTAVGI